MNLVAVFMSCIAMGFWAAGLYRDGGVTTLEPYTELKKLASLGILFASCCDIGRSVLKLGRRRQCCPIP